MKRYYEKYKHIIPLAIFGVIYVLWFYLLEHRTNVQYMVDVYKRQVLHAPCIMRSNTRA